MLDLGWSELLLIAVLAIIVVGPKDLPRMMQTVGRYVAKARAMAQEFQRSFDEIARETELEKFRDEVAIIKNNNPITELKTELENNIEPAQLRTSPLDGHPDAFDRPEESMPDEDDVAGPADEETSPTLSNAAKS